MLELVLLVEIDELVDDEVDEILVEVEELVEVVVTPPPAAGTSLSGSPEIGSKPNIMLVPYFFRSCFRSFYLLDACLNSPKISLSLF